MSQPSAPPAPNKPFQELIQYVSSLEESHKKLASDLQTLQSKLSACEKEKTALLEQFKAISQIQENATKESHKAKQDSEKAKQELEKVKLEMKNSKDIRAEYEAAAKTIITLSDQVETLKKKLIQTEKQLADSMKAKGPELEKKQNNAVDVEDAEQVALQIATLVSENEELKRQISILQQEKEFITKACQRTDAQKQTFAEKCDVLMRQFEEYKTTATSDANKLRKENTHLQMKVLELEEQKHDLTRSMMQTRPVPGDSSEGLQATSASQTDDALWKKYMTELSENASRLGRTAKTFEDYAAMIFKYEDFLCKIMNTPSKLGQSEQKVNQLNIDKTEPTIFDQLVQAIDPKLALCRKSTPEEQPSLSLTQTTKPEEQDDQYEKVVDATYPTLANQ